MFTGLIECTGKVIKVGRELELKTEFDLDLNKGDSLSVNGSCLTVTKQDHNHLFFDISPETFRRIVAPLAGSRVNLERSMSAEGRFQGHFVTGHVDTVGTVSKVKKTSGFTDGFMTKAYCGV